MSLKLFLKRAAALMLIFTLAFSVTACGKKEETGGQNGEGEASSSADNGEDTNGDNKLIVGTEAGFPPYEFMEGDRIVGIDMDIAREIADALGKELEIRNMDFDGALAAVASGKLDFVAAGVSIDEEREKSMDFSDKYVDNTEVIVVNKENPMVAGADDLNGKVIGVQQGNIADIWCSNKENVEPKEVRRYTKFVQAASDLENGKIDCIVMDNLPALEMVEANDKLVILEGEDNVVFQDQYAIAVQKGNTELLEQINQVIKDMKESGKMDEIVGKYADKK